MNLLTEEQLPPCVFWDATQADIDSEFLEQSRVVPAGYYREITFDQVPQIVAQSVRAVAKRAGREVPPDFVGLASAPPNVKAAPTGYYTVLSGWNV